MNKKSKKQLNNILLQEIIKASLLEQGDRLGKGGDFERQQQAMVPKFDPLGSTGAKKRVPVMYQAGKPYDSVAAQSDYERVRREFLKTHPELRRQEDETFEQHQDRMKGTNPVTRTLKKGSKVGNPQFSLTIQSEKKWQNARQQASGEYASTNKNLYRTIEKVPAYQYPEKEIKNMISWYGATPFLCNKTSPKFMLNSDWSDLTDKFGQKGFQQYLNINYETAAQLPVYGASALGTYVYFFKQGQCAFIQRPGGSGATQNFGCSWAFDSAKKGIKLFTDSKEHGHLIYNTTRKEIIWYPTTIGEFERKAASIANPEWVKYLQTIPILSTFGQTRVSDKTGWNGTYLDYIQMAGDWVGLFYPAVDIINASLYAARGRLFEACLSMLAVLPLAGDAFNIIVKGVYRRTGDAVKALMAGFRKMPIDEALTLIQQLRKKVAQIKKFDRYGIIDSDTYTKFLVLLGEVEARVIKTSKLSFSDIGKQIGKMYIKNPEQLHNIIKLGIGGMDSAIKIVDKVKSNTGFWKMLYRGGVKIITLPIKVLKGIATLGRYSKTQIVNGIARGHKYFFEQCIKQPKYCALVINAFVNPAVKKAVIKSLLKAMRKAKVPGLVGETIIVNGKRIKPKPADVKLIEKYLLAYVEGFARHNPKAFASWVMSSLRRFIGEAGEGALTGINYLYSTVVHSAKHRILGFLDPPYLKFSSEFVNKISKDIIQRSSDAKYGFILNTPPFKKFLPVAYNEVLEYVDWKQGADSNSEQSVALFVLNESLKTAGFDLEEWVREGNVLEEQLQGTGARQRNMMKETDIELKALDTQPIDSTFFQSTFNDIIVPYNKIAGESDFREQYRKDYENASPETRKAMMSWKWATLSNYAKLGIISPYYQAGTIKFGNEEIAKIWRVNSSTKQLTQHRLSKGDYIDVSEFYPKAGDTDAYEAAYNQIKNKGGFKDIKSVKQWRDTEKRRSKAKRPN